MPWLCDLGHMSCILSCCFYGVLLVGRERVKDIVIITVLIMVVGASGADLIADLSEGVTSLHLIQEVVVVFLSIIALVWLLLGVRKQSLDILTLKDELEAAKSAKGAPKKYILEGRAKLYDVVTQQFLEWGLTRSEGEIGWLLLKGLSFKEIAVVRNTLEKTVRQHAFSA